MQKYIAAILAGALAISLVGCTPKQSTEAEEALKASDYVTIQDYLTIETGITLKEVTDDEVNTELENFVKEQGGYFEEDEKAIAKDGDKVSITYALEGEDGTSQPADMILGEETLAKEFDKAVRGLKKGDEASAVFEESDLKYHIIVNMISVPASPTDDFIKGLDIKNSNGDALDSVELLKEDIRGFLKAQHTQQYNNDVKEAVRTYILENAQITEIPQEITDGFTQDIKEKINDLKEEKKTQGEEDPQDMDVLTDLMKEDGFVGTTDEYIKWTAEHNAREYLSYLYIAEKENIETTRDEVLSLAANDWLTMTDRYPSLLEFIEKRGDFTYEASALSQKVIRFVAEKSKEGLLPEEDRTSAIESETTKEDENNSPAAKEASIPEDTENNGNQGG